MGAAAHQRGGSNWLALDHSRPEKRQCRAKLLKVWFCHWKAIAFDPEAMRKKIDSRVRTLVENCVKTRHRSLFVIVGDKGRDQVVSLHYMLSKASVKARPSVLWCYKKELLFSRSAAIEEPAASIATSHSIPDGAAL